MLRPTECLPLALVGILSCLLYSHIRFHLFPRHPRFIQTASNQAPGYFAICAVVKDQNEDVREWAQYHLWLGAERIYLYDHNSSAPVLPVVQDLVDAGHVRLTRFAGHHRTAPPVIFRDTAQGYAYSDCLEHARGRFEWLAFIDIDEFLVLYAPPHRNISRLLRRYEAYGGLTVNWRVFGSSGHLCRPRQPTLQAFTACIPGQHINRHVKTIARVPHTAGLGGTPHAFVFRPGYYAATEERKKCNGPRCTPVSLTRIGLHHYVLKSFEQYLAKMARRGGAGSVKRLEHFHAVDQLAGGTCLEAANISRRFFPRPAAAAAEQPPCNVTMRDVRRMTHQQRLAALTPAPHISSNSSGLGVPAGCSNGSSCESSSSSSSTSTSSSSVAASLAPLPPRGDEQAVAASSSSSSSSSGTASGSSSSSSGTALGSSSSSASASDVGGSNSDSGSAGVAPSGDSSAGNTAVDSSRADAGGVAGSSINSTIVAPSGDRGTAGGSASSNSSDMRNDAVAVLQRMLLHASSSSSSSSNEPAAASLWISVAQTLGELHHATAQMTPTPGATEPGRDLGS